MTTHMAWRWKTTHELPKSRSASTEDADSTMTRPTTTSALTTIASRTKSGVDRDEPRRDRLAWRPERVERVERVDRARVRSAAAGMALPTDQLTDGTGEVVAPLTVGVVPVERRTPRRQQHGVPRLRIGGGGAHGVVHRRRHGHRPHAGERLLDVGRRLPDGDNGADSIGGPGEHRKVEALVASAGDQHDRTEAAQGGEGRVRV